MSDHGTSAERPPYWSKCEAMSFGQIRGFIDAAVDRLLDPAVRTDDAWPNSKEELVKLCELLSEKAAELKDAEPTSSPPTYEGPEHPGPFTPSDKLRSLYEKWERYKKQRDDAYEGDSRTVQEWTEDQLKKMEERELAPVEERERHEYAKLLEARRQAYGPYRDRYLAWEAKDKQHRESEAERDKIVRRLYNKVKRIPGADRIITLPFEIAGPGQRTDEDIREYFRGVIRKRGAAGFSQDRLDKVLSLPNRRPEWKWGTAGRYGYIVLQFTHTEKALMECPFYPNALYILDSGEDRLLAMNKQQLRASGKARWIVHAGDWYSKVKDALEIH